LPQPKPWEEGAAARNPRLDGRARPVEPLPTCGGRARGGARPPGQASFVWGHAQPFLQTSAFGAARAPQPRAAGDAADGGACGARGTLLGKRID
jgi:hypothetical protein